MGWKKEKSREFEGRVYLYLDQGLKFTITDIAFNDIKSKWIASCSMEHREEKNNFKIQIKELQDTDRPFCLIGRNHGKNCI